MNERLDSLIQKALTVLNTRTTFTCKVWQWLVIAAVLVLLGLMTGCKSFGNQETPQTQTLGGNISVMYDPISGVITAQAEQPSNPDEAASVQFDIEPYEWTTIPLESKPHRVSVTASTGSSREDKFAGLGLKLDSYKPFTYVGAAMCVIGVGLTIAAFRIPLIPKMAGPIVFVGGGATAYMATAIPEYGHYALIICLIGFVAWYYHQTAAKKDPSEFQKGKPA